MWTAKDASISIPLAELVKSIDTRVVFAESCTGGLVSALFTMNEGISKNHCGCFVTYRPDSKMKWLGISESIVDRYTCESGQMAREMAVAALRNTPEADYSVSVVGHLKAIDDDYNLWIGMSNRETVDSTKPHLSHLYAHRLKQKTRPKRQFEAAQKTFDVFVSFIKGEFHGS